MGIGESTGCNVGENTGISGATKRDTTYVTLLDENFDSLALGTTPTDLGWSTNTVTVVSNDYSLSSPNSFKCTIQEGTTGGGWGWNYLLPVRLYRGDTLRMSAHCYWPTGFDFTADPWLKFMRMANKTSTGASDGHCDVYINKGGNNMRTIIESAIGEPAIWVDADGGMPPIATWINFSWEITFDRSGINQGGLGQRILKRDGVIVQDYRDGFTMSHADGYCDKIIMHDVWNGGAPQTQSCYHDNFKVEYIKT